MDKDKREKYVNRIKKLLMLASSSNAHEASLALARAQDMMRRHGISQSEIMLEEVGTSSTTLGPVNPPLWLTILLDVICGAFGVEYVLSEDRTNKSGKQGRVMFVGIAPNDEISSYCFDVLHRQIKKARKEFIGTLHKNCKRSTLIKRADWYCYGWATDLKYKIVPLAIPLSHRKAIQLWKSRMLNIKLMDARKMGTAPTDSDVLAYLKGKKDSKAVELFAGMPSNHDNVVYLCEHLSR